MTIIEPSLVQSSIVLLGRNSRGQWVVLECNGLFGGLFVNRADAVRYALFENGGHPETLVSMPDVMELDLDRSDLGRSVLGDPIAA